MKDSWIRHPKLTQKRTRGPFMVANISTVVQEAITLAGYACRLNGGPDECLACHNTQPLSSPCQRFPFPIQRLDTFAPKDSAPGRIIPCCLHRRAAAGAGRAVTVPGLLWDDELTVQRQLARAVFGPGAGRWVPRWWERHGYTNRQPATAD